jgi:hypothetical protein
MLYPEDNVNGSRDIKWRNAPNARRKSVSLRRPGRWLARRTRAAKD